MELTGEEEEGGGDEDEQEEPGLRLAGGAAHEQQERQAGARAAAGTEPGVTSLLMLGKGMVPVEREARMLKEKLRFMTWKMLRLPALLPSVMGWEKRQLREVKRVQREQAGMSVMELPPVGFQKPKGELAEYGVSSSDAAALMAAAVEEAGDVDKKIGNMATAASAVHFGPRAWSPVGNLTVTFYTGKGWEKIRITDSGGMSMDVKGSDIRKHATAGGSNDTATLHLQLVRGAKAVGKTAALPPTDSLNETTRPDHYRHMRIDGSQELAAHFEKRRSLYRATGRSAPQPSTAPTSAPRSASPRLSIARMAARH